MISRVRWDRVAIWSAVLAFWFLVVLSMAGCAAARHVPDIDGWHGPETVQATVPTATAKPGQSDEDAAVQRIAFLKRELAAANADLASAHAEADRKRILILQRTCLAVAGVALLGLFAAVALFFIVPAARGTVASAGLACAAVLGTALVAYSTIGYLVALLPWLVLVAAALVLGGVAWGLVQLVRHRRAVQQAAGFGDALKAAVREWRDPALAEDMIAAVKDQAIADQRAAGVLRLVETITGKQAPKVTA